MKHSKHSAREKLIEEGFRITPVREKILSILEKSVNPIAAIDLINDFKLEKFSVNKTTIYRELDFLMERDLISEIELGEGKKRYELNKGHHHHLVCLNCRSINDIDIETDLSEEEKRIYKITGFKVQLHSLEFFGLCRNCQ